MSDFSYERRIPSCHVTKELVSTIEAYLKGDMYPKYGSMLGDEISYQISIGEKIGIETLASVNQYTPSMFSDGTNEIKIEWENGFRAAYRLRIVIRFATQYWLSKVEVKCSAPTAREIALGIGNEIQRLLEPHRTYNWIFNPSEIPFVSVFTVPFVLILLYFGSERILNHREEGPYLLSGAAFLAWLWLSACFFRPVISFDTRRQRLLDSAWRYFSLGTFGFVLFGTVLPLLRKAIVGF